MAKKMKRFDRGGATDVEDDVKTGRFGRDARAKEADDIERKNEVERRMGDRGMSDREARMSDRGMSDRATPRIAPAVMPSTPRVTALGMAPTPTPVVPTTAPLTSAQAPSPLAASAPLTPSAGSAAPSGVKSPTPLAPTTPGGRFVAMKKGGKVKSKSKCMSSGGKVSGASKRADGCAVRGKTKGRNI